MFYGAGRLYLLNCYGADGSPRRNIYLALPYTPLFMWQVLISSLLLVSLRLLPVRWRWDSRVCCLSRRAKLRSGVSVAAAAHINHFHWSRRRAGGFWWALCQVHATEEEIHYPHGHMTTPGNVDDSYEWLTYLWILGWSYRIGVRLPPGHKSILGNVDDSYEGFK